MQCSPKARADAEGGFVLLAAIFLCVLLLISVAIAAPKMARSIQRDKELETIHRGEQYRRAIQLYYRKFQRYPTSIDQLVNTNQIRFLRKKYKDPLTGKDDWKPIYFGQAHVRPLGFFGQPLMAMAGLAGSSASMYAMAPAKTDANGVPVADSGDDSASSTGPASSSSAGSGLFGSSPSTPGTGLGSSPGSPMGSGSMFGNSSPMGGSPTSPMGSSTPGGSSNAAGGIGGTSASTFGGGGPIVGFTLPTKKPSLIDYMKQTAYNKWEFNYDPMADQAKAMAGLAGGGAGAAPNGTNGNNPSSTGQPPNNGSTLMSPDTPPTTDSPDNSSPQPQ